MILEAENRIGGRVYSIPFGTGYIDLGAQWCEGQGEGEGENVVFEMVKNHFEFGDNAIRHENTHCYTSDGHFVDQSKYAKVMNLSDSITSDWENMAKFNGSLGEFFEVNFRRGLDDEELEDVDKELADQIIDFSEKGVNSLYASESWFDVSAKIAGHAPIGNSSHTTKDRIRM